MTDRRTVLTAGLAIAALPAIAGAKARGRPFVQRRGTHLLLDGRTYRFVGANLWYGAYLAAAPPLGDRARLTRELDRLAALGVTNLRVLASSETSPLRGAISPSFRGPGPGVNVALLDGLDHLLVELARRDMRAVLYLANFWEWSGGMMTYLSWVNGGRYIDMNDPAYPWPAFADMASGFYAAPAAVGLYHDYVRSVVGRTNALTGTRYADDPTIMAWQLANEPRPGGSDAVGLARLPDFYRWIAATARLIRSIAPRQLVSTGSEGLKGSLERAAVVEAAHASDDIDYLTAHVWPLNWSWIEATDLDGTAAAGAARVAAYLDAHVAIAARLGKPLVIEEFGYPRDGGRYDPAAGTGHRDRFYRQIHDAVLASARAGGPIAGSNLWAWSGEGRAAHPDFRFRPGDRAFLGDPPHEPQGWYGVFDSDTETTRLIRDHAAALAAS